jgi:hypothetical protein
MNSVGLRLPPERVHYIFEEKPGNPGFALERQRE